MTRFSRVAIPLFSIFYGLFALPGCGESIDDYYPLAVGHSWTYETRYPDGRTRVDTEQIYRRVEQTYFFNNGETVIRLPGTAIFNRNAMRLLRYPIEPGTVWEDNDITFEIVAKGQSTEVPAGTFDQTVTVQWKSRRAAPVTMTADEFASDPAEMLSGDTKPKEPKPGEEREFPMRDFIARTVFAKGIGPIRYELQAAEVGADAGQPAPPLRPIMESVLLSYHIED
ncbi:hypothetical protein K8I61_02390 [bacterium]|nr:hypothetical protein [bacterium]